MLSKPVICIFEQLQQVLSDHLDIRNSATQGQGSTNFDEPTSDINVYFGRKRGKPKKVVYTHICFDQIIENEY